MHCFSSSNILHIRGDRLNIEVPSHAYDQRAASRHAVFGARVLGPIFAEFALRLWIFLSSIEDPDGASVLFCARGGLRLRLIFEHFLKSTGLESPVIFGDLMVSRLIAARAAVLAESPAVGEEIEREFYGESMLTVAQALAQETHELEECWQTPFDALAFNRLLRADLPGSRRLLQSIEEQNALFLSHLQRRAGGRGRIILCDTGLYGSTMRWLERALPHIKWSCVLFARNNYKGFPTDHFARTRGLSVEQNVYVPTNPRTAVLRYWQLIESILEPEIPSVKSFQMVSGCDEPRSNLEIEGWEDRLYPSKGELFAGVLDYMDQIKGEALFKIYEDAARAWHSLKRTVIWPEPGEIAWLGAGERSRDFGRSDSIPPLSAVGPRGLRAILRHSVWREGEIAQSFPAARPLLLACIEGAYIGRWAYRLLRRG